MVDFRLDAPPTLYIFLDEGGNFDFSAKGSKYFSLTCVSLFRPFHLNTKLDTYKYDLLEHRIQPRLNLECFHCANDNRHVKARIFDLLAEGLPNHSVDAVIVEKSKTGPALREPVKFYPKMIGFLLRYAIEQANSEIGEVVVITDSIPLEKKKSAIEKAIKTTLHEMLRRDTPFRVMHHASKAHYGLQIADYMNWAILRKWEKSDCVTYERVASKIRSEFDIFRTGTRHYYEK